MPPDAVPEALLLACALFVCPRAKAKGLKKIAAAIKTNTIDLFT
jgi:hypothetical protein